MTSNGRTRHVHAYLRDFLFSDERARSPVKALSGGERNRLLLARLFTRPANVLVLDEPTNDLDLETLELLEEQLVEWPGRCCSSATIAPSSTTSSPARSCSRATAACRSTSAATTTGSGSGSRRRRHRPGRKRGRRAGGGRASRKTTKIEVKAPAKKLSFKEQRELEALPAKIEALESEQRALAERIASPDFYKEPADAIKQALARVDELPRELTTVYARWDELDARKN